MDYPNNENNNTKHIIIEDLQQNKNMKKINFEKEKEKKNES